MSDRPADGMLRPSWLPPAITLASASPRRAELIRAMGIEPLVYATDADEESVDVAAVAAEIARAGANVGDRLGAEVALRRARLKAAVARPEGDTRLVLAADTTVHLGETILDKPADRDDARRMLRALSGRVHGVHTAVVLRDGATGARAAKLETVDSTLVRFVELSDREIEWLLDTGEWRGVAGGYRIQGAAALLVDRIEGSYTTVVGLPIQSVYSMISRLSETDPTLARHPV